MDKNIIRKHIQKLLSENDLSYWSDFDRNEFGGDAMRAAMADMENDGMTVEPLGKSQYEKDINIEDMIADLERVKLNLPKETKKAKLIQKQIDQLKRFGAGALNEEGGINEYMSQAVFSTDKYNQILPDSQVDMYYEKIANDLAAGKDVSNTIKIIKRLNQGQIPPTIQSLFDNSRNIEEFYFFEKEDSPTEDNDTDEDINTDAVDTSNLYKMLKDAVGQMLEKGMNEAQIAQSLERILSKNFDLIKKINEGVAFSLPKMPTADKRIVKHKKKISEYYNPEDYIADIANDLDPNRNYSYKEFVDVFTQENALLHSRQMNNLIDKLNSMGFKIEKYVDEGAGISQTIKKGTNAKPNGPAHTILSQEGDGISKVIEKGTNVKPTVSESHFDLSNDSSLAGYSEQEKSFFQDVINLMTSRSDIKLVFPEGFSAKRIADKFKEKTNGNLWSVLKNYVHSNPVKISNALFSKLGGK